MLSLGTRICIHLDYESFLGEGMTVIAAKNKIRKIWNLTSQEVEDIVEEQEQFLKDDSLGELV
jgi:hypothetical protein